MKLNTMNEKFEEYYNLLIEVNKIHNLTSITNRQEVFVKHFEDSLQLIRAVPDISEREYTIIDVGSGAGFPGIPLAIEYPNLRVTVTDSRNKRTEFMQRVVEALGLKNVCVLTGRAEDLARQSGLRDSFDIATARAVAGLSTLTELCSPFIHNSGIFVPYKSGSVNDELIAAKNAIGSLKLKIDNVITYQLSNNMGERSLIVMKKISTTPDAFPRKSGIPKKKPL